MLLDQFLYLLVLLLQVWGQRPRVHVCEHVRKRRLDDLGGRVHGVKHLRSERKKERKDYTLWRDLRKGDALMESTAAKAQQAGRTGDSQPSSNHSAGVSGADVAPCRSQLQHT